MSEAAFQAQVMLRWGAHPRVVLWRSNAGQAWVRAAGGMRPIQVNVPGCPDLVGWVEPSTGITFGMIQEHVAMCRRSVDEEFARAKAAGESCPNIGEEFVSLLRGAEELLAMVRPHALFLGIETKADDGRVRESQVNFRKRLEKNRGLYILARSMDDVDAVLVPLAGEP